MGSGEVIIVGWGMVFGCGRGFGWNFVGFGCGNDGKVFFGSVIMLSVWGNVCFIK